MKTRKRQPPRPKSKPKTKTNRAAPARPATQTNNAKGLRTRHGRERTESFPIVGIGASAGGLDALERFFDHMPASSGMAFVVVTHQHAGHTSLMPELIAKHTPMPVSEVTRTTRVEPNQVYLTTPGRYLAILNRTLHLVDGRPGGVYLPVDFFFRSLAQDQKERAIGVILSGTGSDGTLGLQEIKGNSGMVMVQAEQSAKYSGMPHSAIATRLVDYVLPVEQLAAQVLAYARGPYLQAAPPGPEDTKRFEALHQIFILLRNRTRHDFSRYKESTLRRRIERRMTVQHVESLNRYVRFLQTNPAEIELLFKELLIGVTSFFRDTEGWDALGKALRPYVRALADDYVMRLWVPGCSTGEEAYSLAMLLRETMDGLKTHKGVQIFATDLDEDAIDAARAGAYPESIAGDVTEERLDRFFTKEDTGYRIRKEIREMVIFAKQDVIAEPPFTKLDMLSCRNVLIYMSADLQKQLLPMFHYALKTGGFLFLGSSESIGGFADLFGVVDKRAKIFARKELPAGRFAPDLLHGNLPDVSPAELRGPALPPRMREVGLDQMVNRLLMDELIPATVLVHERGDIVHIHGRTGLFLEPAPGRQTTANLFNMARQGLQLDLAAAMRQAVTQREPVTRQGLRVKTNGETASVTIRVRAVTQPEALRGMFLVNFEVEPPAPKGKEPKPRVAASASRLVELERELHYTKETHQGTIEELETTNEELKSMNEELQSTNEELQSANEEMETSKEEMQSLNEELQTVNAELQGKIEELSRTHDDMKNLLNSTDIATIFLDGKLNIKRFTQQATKVISLIASDAGRPIGDLVTKLEYPRMAQDAQEVLRTLVPNEAEIRGLDGSWYLVRMLPYRTADNVIDGLVVTFVEVTRVKALQEVETGLQTALELAQVGVMTQDRDLRVTWAYAPTLGFDGQNIRGKTDDEFLPATEARDIIALKRGVLETGKPARGSLPMTIGGRRGTYDLQVEPARDAGGELVGLISVLSVHLTPHASVRKLRDELAQLASRCEELDRRNKELEARLRRRHDGNQGRPEKQ